MARVVGVRHLSQSSLALYGDCARLWKGLYLDHLPRTRSPALVIGSAFDAVLERALRDASSERAGGPAVPVTPQTLLARWVAAWREQLHGDGSQRTGAWTERAPEPIVWGDEPEAQAEASGRALVLAPETAALLRELRPALEPDGPALQRRVTLTLPGVGVPVIGYLDAVLDDGTPCDFKTARRPWAEDKAFRELQPRLYLLALRAEGFPLARTFLGKWAFRHYVWTRPGPGGGRVRLQRIDTAFADDDLALAAEAVQASWRGMQAGAYPPNLGSWRCGYGCAVREAGQCLGAGERSAT
jgi:hypothetical protein